METTAAFVQNWCSNALLSGHSSKLSWASRSCSGHGTRDVSVFFRPSSVAKIASLRMCAQTEERPEVDESSKKQENPGAPPYVTIERYVAAAAYAGFVIFVLFLAPGSITDTGELQKILGGKIEEVNDLFFAIFNLVGVIGINFAAVLNAGAAQQKKLSTGLFSGIGAVVGFLVLGPYLIGREYVPNVKREEVDERGLLSRILESRLLGVTALLYTLWIYGFTFGLFTPGSEQLHDAMFYGSSVDYGRLFFSDRSVCTTTIDTVILSTLFWGPLTEDMRRRGWFRTGQETESWLTALSILSAPGLGHALYLVLRPRLPGRASGSVQSDSGE